MRGDAVGQFQETLQPLQTFASEGFDFWPGIGAGEDVADSEGEDGARGCVNASRVLETGQCAGAGTDATEA